MAARAGVLVAALLAAPCLLVSGSAAAPPSFRYERPVVVGAPGPHALPVDVPLLTGSQPFRIEAHAGPHGTTLRPIARGGLRDLRFFDGQGREVPYLLVEPPLPEPEWQRAAVSVPVTFDRRASEPGTSRFRLHLAAPSLPVVALRLTVGAAHLLRRARVTEARLAGEGAVPVRLGEATLKRAVRDSMSASELRIPLEPPTTSQLELEVDDGDNPPLELRGVDAELAELPWIFLEVDEPRPIVARWGDAHLEAPRYDLESSRERAEHSAPPPAAWGPAVAPAQAVALEPPAALPETGPPIDTTAFRYARELPEGPAGLVAVPLDAAVLAHSSGRHRSDFADLRVVDAAGRQLPYLLERRPEPLVVALPALAAAASRLGPGTSVYRLQLPYADLPPSRLVLRTTAHVFDRRLDVLVERPDPRGRRRGPATETVASATWQHAEPDTPAPALCLSLPTLAASAVLLAVREGDNAPLPLERPELLLPSFQVRFFRPGPGVLRILYGQERLPAPRYDLALLAPTVLASPAVETALAAEQQSKPTPAAVLDPRAFWAILVAAAVVLLLLIARLVGRAESSRQP
jgi:hypothetical protein